MKKDGLVKYVCEVTGLTLDNGQSVVQAVLDGIVKGCEKEGEVVLRKFGTFKMIQRPPRKVVFSIAGGGSVNLPARRGFTFKPSDAIKA